MRLSIYAAFSLGGLALLAASVALWLRFGEMVFFDRIAAGIAGCF
ncbi:hypothetical protein [Roseibium sp.]